MEEKIIKNEEADFTARVDENGRTHIIKDGKEIVFGNKEDIQKSNIEDYKNGLIEECPEMYE